jgi:hypothetical protein
MYTKQERYELIHLTGQILASPQSKDLPPEAVIDFASTDIFYPGTSHLKQIISRCMQSNIRKSYICPRCFALVGIEMKAL